MAARGSGSGIKRLLGDGSLQMAWQTVVLEATGLTGVTATYPLLYPITAGDYPAHTFTNDSVLLGVFFSTTWQQANAAESACVAVASRASAPINALGQNQSYFQHVFYSFAGAGAGVLVQRNPGAMFPPPLVKFIPASTTLQLFGSKQNVLNWRTQATLYFIPAAQWQSSRYGDET